MKKLKWRRTVGAVCALLVASAAASAQTFKILYSFCAQYGCPDGSVPEAGLVQGTSGSLYGAVPNGLASGDGGIFKITPGGTLTAVASFSGTYGSNLDRGLLLASDGNFYGTANGSGNHGAGTVYKVTPDGKITVLYNFCQNGGCTDGSSPQCVLVEGTDGNFYGTTSGGGTDGYGTVFRITPAGKLTTLHFFA